MQLYKFHKIIAWWLQLNQREQRMITLGGSVVVLFIGYAIFWSPLLSAAQLQRERIQHNQQLLSWMQTADQQISEALKKSPHTLYQDQALSPVSAMDLLQREAVRAAIKEQLTELKQSNKDTIELHYHKVDFDHFAQWMIAIHQQGLQVTQLSIKRTATAGQVNVDMLADISN